MLAIDRPQLTLKCVTEDNTLLFGLHFPDGRDYREFLFSTMLEVNTFARYLNADVSFTDPEEVSPLQGVDPARGVTYEHVRVRRPNCINPRGDE